MKRVSLSSAGMSANDMEGLKAKPNETKLGGLLNSITSPEFSAFPKHWACCQQLWYFNENTVENSQ